MRFLALLKKELLLLSKDVHGLLALFVMPAVFILIMSLAMQKSLGGQEVTVQALLVNHATGEFSDALVARLKELNGFTFTEVDEKGSHLQEALIGGNKKFAVIIPAEWNPATADKSAGVGNNKHLQILMAPSVDTPLRKLFSATVHGIVARITIDQLVKTLSDNERSAVALQMAEPDIDERYVQRAGVLPATPTAVQQSVPAWLVFSMFFVVIPISTAYIIERQQGTLVRLQVINIPSTLSLLAKVVPYYLVNQVQMVLMVLVGMYLVPQLGGSRLEMADSPGSLLIVSSATSLAAIGYALMLSVFAKTTVQATTLGGISNIIFGALGGVMVPKFIMPEVMQRIAIISPMSWGMEGFLDVFLRHAGWKDVLPEAGALMLFGGFCLAIASAGFSR